MGEKIIWKIKGTRIDKMIMKKKKQMRGIYLPDFRIYVTTIIKIMVLVKV